MRREVQDQEGELAFYNATGSLLMKIRKSFGFTENNEKRPELNAPVNCYRKISRATG